MFVFLERRHDFTELPHPTAKEFGVSHSNVNKEETEVTQELWSSYSSFTASTGDEFRWTVGLSKALTYSWRKKKRWWVNQNNYMTLCYWAVAQFYSISMVDAVGNNTSYPSSSCPRAFRLQSVLADFSTACCSSGSLVPCAPLALQVILDATRKCSFIFSRVHRQQPFSLILNDWKCVN